MKRFYTTLICVLAVQMGGQFSVRAAASSSGLEDTTAFLAGALSEFLSDSRSFTATTELSIRDQAGATDSMTLSFGSAFDMGKMRMDLNLSSAMNQSAGAGIRVMGINRIMFIGYPDNPARVVFPDMKSYMEVPLDQSPQMTQKAGDVAGKLEKKLVGNETIQGVATKKYQLQAAGSKDVAYVWQAPALNDLPIRLQAATGGKVYTFTFKNVRQGAVDPRVFGIPATFKKADGLQAISQLAMSKLAEQAKSLIPQ